MTSPVASGLPQINIVCGFSVVVKSQFLESHRCNFEIAAVFESEVFEYFLFFSFVQNIILENFADRPRNRASNGITLVE